MRKDQREGRRLARRTLKQSTLWVAVGTISIIAVAVPVIIGLSFETMLGVSGLALALVGLAVPLSQDRVKRPFRVGFLSSSRSYFTSQILEGLKAGLDGQIPVQVVDLFPVGATRLTSEAQVQCLRSEQARQADAIVIRPSELSDLVLGELMRLAGGGRLVVFINTPPPWDKWTASGLVLPRFVGSDMKSGGQLIGDLVTEAAATLKAEGVLLLEGPESKVSNSTRSAWAARQVLRSGYDKPVVLVQVGRFDSEHLLAALFGGLAKIDNRVGKKAGAVIVHAGTDSAAAIVADLAAAKRDEDNLFRRKIFIVGYDGLMGPDGLLMVEHKPGILATIDQRPNLLGQEAAEHIKAVAERRGQSRQREVTVSPRAVRTVLWTSLKLRTPRSRIHD